MLLFSCGDLFFINFINTFAINQATGQTDSNFIGKFVKVFFFRLYNLYGEEMTP